MTVRQDSPTSYRHWSGRSASIEPDGPWPWPRMVHVDETWFKEVTMDDHWLNAGYAPRGSTRWRRFWRHWHHGRLMRYPRLSVLAFCIRDLRIDPPRVADGSES